MLIEPKARHFIHSTSDPKSQVLTRLRSLPWDRRHEGPYPLQVTGVGNATSIEPVPETGRVLGAFDTGLLWGNLGVSLLVVVSGAILVPALSLGEAAAAIALGCLVGNIMLASAAAIGAQAGVPGMVLLRAPLGSRGSILPTAINVLQCLGWTTFELIVIAAAAGALSEDLLGFEARWAWALLFGALALVLGLLGPVAVVRGILRRFGAWLVLVALGYLTWWAFQDVSLAEVWRRDGEGGLSVWQGADLVVGLTVSWVPLVADYSRYCRSPRSAFLGVGVGYGLAGAWMLGLGVVLVLSRGLGDAAELPPAVVGGGLVAAFALLALTVAETDEAFANAYSGAVSLQNLTPGTSRRLLVVGTTGLGTVGALVLDLVSYQSFLLLLGSVFVPLFAVLVADWLAAGRRYTRDDLFAAPPLRPGPLAAWAFGFLLYQWLYPTGPVWWIDQVERLQPPSWGIPVTFPSFLATLALALPLARRSRRAAAGTVRP